jgi:hypothetical protein
MRDFSVIRRRKNIVDLLTPKRANVAGYRFQVATNFDQAYATILTAPIGSGYLDPAVNPAVLHSVNNNDHIRVVFNPNTFSGAGISDSAFFWMRFVPVDFAGTPGTAGPGTLILTDEAHYGNSRIQIAGTAPIGAAVANSLQLNLPQNSQDFSIKNANASAGNALFVSFTVGGAEQQVSAQEVMKAYDGPSDTLMVRGAGGTAAFSASFTNYLPL